MASGPWAREGLGRANDPRQVLANVVYLILGHVAKEGESERRADYRLGDWEVAF